jgi:hypothetical protein
LENNGFIICSFEKALNEAAASGDAALSVRGGASDAAAPAKGGLDFGLIAYFALWYLGNYYVRTIANRMTSS